MGNEEKLYMPCIPQEPVSPSRLSYRGTDERIHLELEEYLMHRKHWINTNSKSIFLRGSQAAATEGST